MVRFVNPYTFVPHVVEPVRGGPAGHDMMRADHLSGVLKITLTARTPLLIGGFSRPGPGGEQQHDLPRRADGAVMVPGSGRLGAVRSVHEALAGGCLRVLDADRVPVHRHPATTEETKDLRLAVVTDVDADGRATWVALCVERIWIPQELLPRDGGRLPRSGDQLRFRSGAGGTVVPPAGAVGGPDSRCILRARTPEHSKGVTPEDLVRVGGLEPVAGECWVLLVTDTNARAAARPVYFAAGRIGPGAPSYQIPPPTWKRYQDVVADADDLRPARLVAAGFKDGEEPGWGACPPEYEDVWWPPQDAGGQQRRAIAQRMRARSYLHLGQPVWVRVDDRGVTEIRLSQLWRYQGDGTIGERVGEAGPCTDPAELCWSCRVFGSADTGGREARDLAMQNSYRGHVRVDDLLAAGPVEPQPWRLAPLASPRPSAGQFYLDHRAVPSGKRVAAKDTRPAAPWGSAADTPRPRPLRGRKFYWRTTEPTEGPFPRGRTRDHQSDVLSTEVALIPAGTVFTGRVMFDNLSAADYGSLLAALDPRLMAGAGPECWADAVISVGGGKPFGFGSVRIDVEPVLVQTAQARYLGADARVPDKAEAVRAFRDQVPSSVPVTWQALEHALAFGFVADDLVWYPPGPDGAKGSEGFDKSFEFFPRTAGLELKNRIRDRAENASASPEAQVADSQASERPWEVQLDSEVAEVTVGESEQDLVVVTVRSVQSFIAEARSTADLNAGSAIISELSAAMVKAAQSFNSPVALVMPSQARQGTGVPNRIAARVTAGHGRKLAESIAHAAGDAWRDRVLAISPDPGSGAAMTAGFPDVQWVVVGPVDGGYKEQWDRASVTLARRKRIRNFEFPPADQVRVCSLTGRWKAMSVPHGQQPWNVRKDEALSIVGHVKRKFSRDAKQSFPSTWSVATAPYRAAIIEAAGKDAGLRQAVAEFREYTAEFLAGGCSEHDRAKLERSSAPLPGLPATEDKDLAWLRSVEGSWCTPSTWEPTGLRMSYELAEFPDADICYLVKIAAHDLAEKAAQGGLSPLTPYLAVIAQDADHMGAQLGEFPDDVEPSAWHKKVSAALVNAAKSQREAIERVGNFGRVVYAGGDDLLALTPAATALACAAEANAVFQGRLSELLETPTASAAIVYFHASSPLQTAVAAVQVLLEEAKKAGRPGLGIAVLRRGGERSRLIVPWRDPANPGIPMTDHVNALATSMAGGGSGLSGRLASELERDRDALATLSPEWLRRELLRRNARHGGAEASNALLALGHEDSSGRRRLPSQAVSVARFLAAEAVATGSEGGAE